MEQNEVAIALDIVIEEISAEISTLQEAGAQALRAGRYDLARELTDRCSQVAQFQARVRDLKRDWSSLAAGALPGLQRPARPPAVRRSRSRGRLPSGLRTPEDEYRIPILQSLVELGGSAQVREVLERVETKMASRFTPHDRQTLPSSPRSVRWQNAAQWCRRDLIVEGLLSSRSPHGVWEITEAGRSWLEEALNRSEHPPIRPEGWG